MTSEMIASFAQAVAAVLVAAMLCAAGLSAWRGWLAYKRLQLETERRVDGASIEPREDEQTGTGSLIELAAVKERLRRLEAIASGVEL
jgi:hypothetical protein